MFAWSQSLPGLGFTGPFKHPFEPSGNFEDSRLQEHKAIQRDIKRCKDHWDLAVLPWLATSAWTKIQGQNAARELRIQYIKSIQHMKMCIAWLITSCSKVMIWGCILTNTCCKESPAPASQSHKWTDPGHGQLGRVGRVLGQRSRRSSLHQWVRRDVAVNEMKTNRCSRWIVSSYPHHQKRIVNQSRDHQHNCNHYTYIIYLLIPNPSSSFFQGLGLDSRLLWEFC